MRILKIVGIAIVSLLGLLLLTVAAINVVPGESYKGLISAAVKSATGRDLVIGKLDVELGSSFRVAAADVSLSNADWGSRVQMFTGELIECEVALGPLLGGVLDVRLVLDAPDLLLETDAEGRRNWQMEAGPPADEMEGDDLATGDGGGSLRPLLREVRLDRVKVGYADAQAGTRHAAEFETILISSQGNRVQVKLDGRLDDQLLVLAGGIDESAVSETAAPADFSLSGKLGDIGLNARGTLDAISADAHAKLLLEAKVPSLATLSVFAGRDLPDQGPLDASLRLSGGEGRFSAQDIKLNLGAELLTATVAGAVADLNGLSGIDLDVSAKTQRLPDLVKQLGVELPGELPPMLDGEAKLQGSLEELVVAAYRVGVNDDGVAASVKGQVANAMALTGIQADLTLETGSLAALSKYAATELPDTGPVKLSGKLASPQGLEAPSEVSAAISADGVNGKMSGGVENLMAATGIALLVDVEADSLQQLARLAGQDLQQKEPLKLNTRLSLDQSTYRADKLQVALGDSQMTGVLAFTQPAEQGARAKLQGELHLGKLDLDTLFGRGETKPTGDASASQAGVADQAVDAGATSGGAVAEVPAAASDDAAAGKADKVFSPDPLPFEALRSLDIDIDITADEVATRELIMQQVTGKLALNSGRLKLGPVRASVGQGSLQASNVLDASRSPATLAVDVDLDNGTSRYYGGRFNLKADLDGTGDSVAQLMAGLDGQILVDLRDMELKKSLLTQFGQGLLQTVDPSDKGAETTELVCAIMRFDVKDGIADAEEKIVAQFTKVTWFGGGTIDLKTEALDIGAQSKPRVGVGSIGGLAGLVQVGGTLANPKIVPDPKGMAKAYGETYLTVVTGGLYLLVKGIWDKTQADSDVCAAVLAKRTEAQGEPVVDDSNSEATKRSTPELSN